MGGGHGEAVAAAEHVGEMGGAMLSATLGDFGKRDVGVFDEVLHFVKA